MTPRCWRANQFKNRGVLNAGSPMTFGRTLPPIVLLRVYCVKAAARSAALQELLGPVGAIEGAVLNGFAEVAGLDAFGGVEVGDGAGDFENAVVGARGKGEAGDGVFEQFFSVGGDGGVFVHHLWDALCVGVRV